MVLDESTIKTGIQTKKVIYQENEENKVEISKESFSVNFECVLGLNTESTIFPIKNLNEFEFGKTLLKIRNIEYDENTKYNILNDVIINYDLSIKEIRKIIEETDENNPEFKEKLLRSMKNNKKDKSSILARKLGKHCKRESTENEDKRKETKYNHIRNLLKNNNISSIFENQQRIVLILDNAKAHKTDLVLDIAKTLNIYLLFLPPYSPELNPVEKVWDIQKMDIRNSTITDKENIINETYKIFENKCKSDSLYKNYVEKYIPIIS